MSHAPATNGLTYHDFFCGAGGSSIGLTGAGFRLMLGANHWKTAIETHAANFPHAEHLCADLTHYDLRLMPKADVLWASPICTEASPAGGRRRTRGQEELELFGPVAKEGMERTRATFWEVVRATELFRYQAVLVENVVEVAANWELFDHWVEGMKLLGYNVQFVSVSSAHIGGPGNPHAPQWRDRLYMVFTRTGAPLPDVEPRPLARCAVCDEDVPAVQVWKRPGRKIGKYRQQYFYVCPNQGCRHAQVEPYVLPAAAAIDWSDLGTRIGDRKRPLAVNTRARIEAGLRMFAQPITLEAAGNTFERRPGVRTWPAYGAPLTTQTTTSTKGLAVAPFLTEHRRNGGPIPIGEPTSTITAGGNHHSLVVPPGAFYVKNFGGNAVPRDLARSVGEPFGTVTARDSTSLVIPFRRGVSPYPAARIRQGESRMDVDDCLFRMLNPREHLRAQRFPDSYVVLGNQGEQTMQAGNAVSANVAQWLGGRVAAALCGEVAA